MLPPSSLVPRLHRFPGDLPLSASPAGGSRGLGRWTPVEVLLLHAEVVFHELAVSLAMQTAWQRTCLG